jgi:hypothetical protein
LPYQKGEWFVSNFVLPARNRFLAIGGDLGASRDPKLRKPPLFVFWRLALGKPDSKKSG